MPSNEWIDNEGHVWYLDDCQSEEVGCVVLKRYMTKNPKVQENTAQAISEVEPYGLGDAMSQVFSQDSVERSEPDDEIHIPLDMAGTVGRALIEHAEGYGGRDADEG